MKRIALFLFFIFSVITCLAQTQIDPTYQIQWNLISGSGSPTITCTQNGNYTVYPYGAEWGQPYQDTTNNNQYVCTTSGWVKLNGSGGPPSGSAGGDLSGSYPNPGVAGFGGIPFSNTPAPDLGDLICYDGVEYTPCPPEAGAAQILYLTNTASDIGSDFLWDTAPLGAQFTATQTIPATTTKTAIKSFATASTFPDATTISAGEWQADSYVQVSGAANTTTLQIDVYDVHSDGSSPVLLFSFPNQTISGNGTGIQEQTVEAIEPAFTMAGGATDRLLITYSMTKTGGASITGTLYGGGSANYSHVHTPIGTASGGITQLTGDVAAGPGIGSQAATLATVNSSPGSYTNANITVNGKGLVTAASNGSGGGGGSVTTGPGLVTTGANIQNAFSSNSVPPQQQYQPNTPYLYYPLLTTSQLTSSTGLSNASGGGLIATSAGTNGTGYITLPVLPAGVPWRVNVAFSLSDSTNGLGIGIMDASHDYWSGLNFTYAMKNNNISGYFGGNSVFNTYAGGGAAPNGTVITLEMSSDGTQICWNFIPDGSALQSIGGAGGYNAAWNGGTGGGCEPFTWSTGGHTPLENLSTIVLQNASITSKVLGVAVQIGSLDGVTDGLMPDPLLLSYGLPIEGPNQTTYPLQVFLPDNYGNPAGTPLVFSHHPNANSGQFYATAQSTYALLIQNGYAIGTVTGDPISANYSDATSSNWGASAGMIYRYSAVNQLRTLFPGLAQLFHYGLSMGGLTAPEYELNQPGSAAIYDISPAANLTNACNNTTGYGGFTSVIKAAYGSWWQATVANSNENPTSTSGYWTQINNGFNAPPLGYYAWGASSPAGPGLYYNQEAWSSATSYNTNDIVYVPTTSACSALAAYDPSTSTNETALSKGPPLRVMVGASDALIPPADQIAFCTGVATAASSTCTSSVGYSGKYSYSQVSGQAHLGSGLFIPSDVLGFFNAYRTSWPSTTGAPYTSNCSPLSSSCTTTGTGKSVSQNGAILYNATVDNVTPTVMGYMDATSSIQTQLNAKQASLGLVAGTLTDGDLCKYTSSGTLLSCTVPNVANGSYTPTGTWNWTSATATWPTFNQSTSGTSAGLSGTPALPNGTTATTQSAGNNSTDVATTAYNNIAYTLINASGSPYTMAALSGTYWQNTASSYSWLLPTPVTGLMLCFGNYKARAQAISLIPGSGVTIYYNGIAGTSGSSIGLVSGATAGAFVCVVGTDSTTYEAIGPGVATWTNN